MVLSFFLPFPLHGKDTWMSYRFPKSIFFILFYNVEKIFEKPKILDLQARVPLLILGSLSEQSQLPGKNHQRAETLPYLQSSYPSTAWWMVGEDMRLLVPGEGGWLLGIVEVTRVLASCWVPEASRQCPVCPAVLTHWQQFGRRQKLSDAVASANMELDASVMNWAICVKGLPDTEAFLELLEGLGMCYGKCTLYKSQFAPVMFSEGMLSHLNVAPHLTLRASTTF